MEKKKRFRRTKRFVKRIFAYDFNKGTSLYLADLAKKNFSSGNRDEDQKASFSALGYSDDSLERISKNLIKQVVVAIAFALLGLLLCIFEIFLGHWTYVITSFLFSVVMLVVAFRYHFWLFQVRQKKLGCTLQEWRDATFSKLKVG